MALVVLPVAVADAVVLVCDLALLIFWVLVFSCFCSHSLSFGLNLVVVSVRAAVV